MEWTDISITVAKRDADTAEAIATMVANGGIYIEDYSDLEQQAWEIAHVDLIEQELLDKPRDVVIVHMYLAPDENPAEVLPLFEERLKNSGIDYQLNTTGVEQEDWQNGWKKFYHAMDIGERLAIVPMCVRTAGENAQRNGVADKFTVLVGDLSDQASGEYNIITANIVAAAILSLAPHVPVLMAPGARFIASGIIDERRDEVLTGLKAAGLTPIEVKEKRGWVCIICKKSDEKEA